MGRVAEKAWRTPTVGGPAGAHPAGMRSPGAQRRELKPAEYGGRSRAVDSRAIADLTARVRAPAVRRPRCREAARWFHPRAVATLGCRTAWRQSGSDTNTTLSPSTLPRRAAPPGAEATLAAVTGSETINACGGGGGGQVEHTCTGLSEQLPIQANTASPMIVLRQRITVGPRPSLETRCVRWDHRTPFRAGQRDSCPSSTRSLRS